MVCARLGTYLRAPRDHEICITMDERTPQDQVCTISELVEAILLQAHLSPLELLVVRATNRTFNDVILNALPFREALWLKPNTSTNPTDPNIITLNPFLEQIFSRGQKTYFNRDPFSAMVAGILLSQGRACKRCYSKQLDLAKLPDEQCYLHLPILDTGDEEEYFTPAVWDEKALWRRMYATNPVIPIHVVDAHPIAHKWECAATTTMGGIMDQLVMGEVLFATAESRAKYKELRERLRREEETRVAEEARGRLEIMMPYSDYECS
ncbi:hypothetical protein B0J11DRAFT_523381 [Dendryphion nanum]|uniref:F-box domain-containing protein n=1 Tax=Dendryphion nanum TaxID=256645 RepID=A0A9P9E5X8_9PLEO|nr:hypothetical protein B0J11DRAFT_523381 [Dendryphion nanum]